MRRVTEYKHKHYTEYYDDWRMNIKIKDKKVGAILTDQRCGSTTLCGYIDQLKSVQCLYEAFSANGSLYSSKITYPLEDYINRKMEKMPWLSEKNTLLLSLSSLTEKFLINSYKKV